MAQRFPGVTRSPVPVLLPFDTEALLRDLAAGTAADGNERYLSGFQASKFFYPGPSGYDAVFSLRTAEVPELADIKLLRADRRADLRLGAALRARRSDAAVRRAGRRRSRPNIPASSG